MRRFWTIALIMALAAIPGRAQQNMPPTDVPVPADKLVQMKISRPQPLNNVEASFSDEAREKRINGRCLASITVDVRGMPQDIKLIRCTDPSFQASSLAAVGQYRFKPAMMPDGKPIPVKINVEISYHIDDWAARLELGQPLVHLQAILKSPTLGVMVSQDLQRLDILRITANQTLHEGDFDIQLARFFARQPFAFGTALLRHTTASIIPRSS